MPTVSNTLPNINWMLTSILLKRVLCSPRPLLPLFSNSLRLVRLMRQAGKPPLPSQTTTIVSALASIILPFNDRSHQKNSVKRPRPILTNAPSRYAMPKYAHTQPANNPAQHTRNDSSKSDRAILAGVAPSALRTASSWIRSSPRATNRLPMLKATSSTMLASVVKSAKVLVLPPPTLK